MRPKDLIAIQEIEKIKNELKDKGKNYLSKSLGNNINRMITMNYVQDSSDMHRTISTLDEVLTFVKLSLFKEACEHLNKEIGSAPKNIKKIIRHLSKILAECL